MSDLSMLLLISLDLFDSFLKMYFIFLTSVDIYGYSYVDKPNLEDTTTGDMVQGFLDSISEPNVRYLPHNIC